jgi:hypothetical protein
MSDDLDKRLAAASDRLDGLGASLQAGGPWALAERFDHSPEASWGPRETLAHLEEMLLYWLGEAERILDDPTGGATLGRTATNDVRLAIIERDRTLPIRELVARVRVGIDRWRRYLQDLDAASVDRTGTHVTLGTVTVNDVAKRFAVGHLEDHLDQLEGAINAPAGEGGAVEQG